VEWTYLFFVPQSLDCEWAGKLCGCARMDTVEVGDERSCSNGHGWDGRCTVAPETTVGVEDRPSCSKYIVRAEMSGWWSQADVVVD
jgi:hypothetical protein